MIGVGTDIVAIGRIEAVLAKHGDRFLARCFRPDEIALARRRGRHAAATLAARWAAKEAFLKALGAQASRVLMSDVEVVRAESGAVSVRLHGTAAAALARRGAGSIHLSLSHEKDYAVAVVLLT